MRMKEHKYIYYAYDGPNETGTTTKAEEVFLVPNGTSRETTRAMFNEATKHKKHVSIYELYITTIDM